MRMKLFWFPTVCLMLAGAVLPGRAFADQKDPVLPELFAALKTAHSQSEAEPYVAEIWRRWSYVPDYEASVRMLRGLAHMQAGDLNAAISEFDVLVEMAPDFAEGWNRRATAYFYIGEFEKSVLDIQKTLALEPRHFGALSGLAMIYNELGKDEAALIVLKKVREINPNTPMIDENIKTLQEHIKGKQT